jgi:hypothetical protein
VGFVGISNQICNRKLVEVVEFIEKVHLQKYSSDPRVVEGKLFERSFKTQSEKI